MSKKFRLLDDVESAVRGGATVCADNKFNTEVRNMDAGDPLAVGDVIHIPEDYKVLKQPINGSDKEYPFILVTVSNKESGSEKCVRFFPNQLAKVAYPLDAATAKRLPKLKTTGSAAAKYATFSDVDAAMDFF